jgi:hypothetical protein
MFVSARALSPVKAGLAHFVSARSFEHREDDRIPLRSFACRPPRT